MSSSAWSPIEKSFVEAPRFEGSGASSGASFGPSAAVPPLAGGAASGSARPLLRFIRTGFFFVAPSLGLVAPSRDNTEKRAARHGI